MAKVDKKMAMFHLGVAVEKYRTNMHEALWQYHSISAYDCVESEMTGVLNAYVIAGFITDADLDDIYDDLMEKFWNVYRNKREEMGDCLQSED